MPCLYIDYECAYIPKVLDLKSCSLREYLEGTHVTATSWAVDDGPLLYHIGAPTQEMLDEWRKLALDPDVCVVAHNAAFDVRVWRVLLGLPQPHTVHCTLELACAAFPNQPGGYSLARLAETLNLGVPKLVIDLRDGHHTQEQLRDYVCRDTELCRVLHRACVTRLHPAELRVAELANDVRELYFEIDPDRVNAALATFSDVVAEEALGVAAILGDEAFGRDGETVKSIKPLVLREQLRTRLGFRTESTSKKKINPEKLRRNQQASIVVDGVARANKALSHKRRTKVFEGRSVVDAELGYFRAHTGRYSSPSVGKGLNLHNLPKRDKEIAKAIRSCFRLPNGLCWVRADEANVEYRIEGLLTGCQHTTRLFGSDVYADPYLGFGFEATGKQFRKSDPIRQLFKAAVLGLGYGMGMKKFCEELLLALANPKSGITLQDLEQVALDQGWRCPNFPYARRTLTELGCPPVVVAVAHHMRARFHAVHPEFKAFADWLVQAVEAFSRTTPDNAERVKEWLYRQPGAPNMAMVDVSLHYGSFGPDTATVRVKCGPWFCETVTWRDLDVRRLAKGGMALTFVQSGSKPPKVVSPNLLIENVIQSAARNATCMAKLHLSELGYPYIMSVHDEIMLAVPREVDWVTRAKRDLIKVLGPGGMLDKDWGWAAVIDATEINVSESLFEVDMDKIEPNWWDKLPTNPQFLENLP